MGRNNKREDIKVTGNTEKRIPEQDKVKVHCIVMGQEIGGLTVIGNEQKMAGKKWGDTKDRKILPTSQGVLG